MKTGEAFLREIAASKELQTELKAASSEEGMKAFLTKHGCDANVQTFLSLVRAYGESGITDADADAVAGGCPAPAYLQDLFSHDIFRPL